MAHLPAVQNSPAEADPVDEAIAAGLAKGLSIVDIAKRISPHADRREAKRIRQLVRRRVRGRPAVASELTMLAREEHLRHVVPAMRGLGMRAAAGRSDAAKVVLELAGLWQPTSRHQHDHSGEVDIRLHSMPRPKAVDSTAEED